MDLVRNKAPVSRDLARAKSKISMQKWRNIAAVVDDNPSMRRAAEDLLGASGFATEHFASAEDFIDSGAATQIDCLLLDINLGGMSGIELRRKLAASGSPLPVIFMTGLDDEGMRRDALVAGCAAYLQKPFTARQLLDALEKAKH
jgi:FixJ family two-component response regulator